jgi:hypothetical protein
MFSSFPNQSISVNSWFIQSDGNLQLSLFTQIESNSSRKITYCCKFSCFNLFLIQAKKPFTFFPAQATKLLLNSQELTYTNQIHSLFASCFPNNVLPVHGGQ